MGRGIDEAIAELRSRPTDDVQAARRADLAAREELDTQYRMLGALGERQYAKLEGYVRRALAPHRVEWTHRDSMSIGAHDVNYADWTTSAHLYGHVWPQPKGKNYAMQARVHIPFSLTPRDGDEFRRMVAMLKAMADAARDGGL